MTTVQTAIDNADPAALRRTLEETPAAANELIHWGPDHKNTAHPLHYVCDKFFDKTLSVEIALAMTDILLGAGSDVNGLPENRETALHGAASLGAEDVGLRLVEAGANVQATGSFAGETPLHWAAHEGMVRLVTRLIAAGADLTVRDKKWNGTPLDWADHGLRERRAGTSGGQEEVMAILSQRAASPV
jgi:ankyrin repeat protein